MTEEQVKNNADEYARKEARDHILEKSIAYNSSFRGYMKGYHSRDEEVEELKKLLDNAVEILKDTYEDDDYFCTRLLDIDEEAKVCENNCKNLKKECIIRYLKRYKIVK